MFRNQSRKSPQFKQLVKRQTKQNFNHVRQFIKQKTSNASSLPHQQAKKDKTMSTVLVINSVSRLEQHNVNQDNKTQPDYTPINSLIEENSFQSSQVQTQHFSILQAIKCDTCQTLQQLYKSQISMLRNYCDYVKEESMSFQKQLHKYKQKCINFQRQKESHYTQTELIQVFHKSQMTMVEGKNLTQLEESLLATQQFKNTLMKEVEAAHQTIDQLEQEKKELTIKLQKSNQQLSQQISATLQIQEQMNKYRQKLQVYQNIGKHSHGNQTQLTNQRISEIIENNNSLTHKSQYLQKNISKILSQLRIEQNEMVTFNNQQFQISLLISQNVNERVNIHIKPLQEEISLLKQLMENQKRKHEQREIHLQSLLRQAYQSIQSLLSELKISKDQAKTHYFDILLSQKNKNAIKTSTQK